MIEKQILLVLLECTEIFSFLKFPRKANGWNNWK